MQASTHTLKLNTIDFWRKSVIFFLGLSNFSNDAKEKVLFGAGLVLLSETFQVPCPNSEQTQASNSSDLEIINIADFSLKLCLEFYMASDSIDFSNLAVIEIFLKKKILLK